MLLYCFITHRGQLMPTRSKVSAMMNRLGIDHYLVVSGGCPKDRYDQSQNTLHLCCNDHYEGLPEKIYRLFCYLANHPEDFGAYTHFLKCDEDTCILKKFKVPRLKKWDYAGVVTGEYGRCARDYHQGKCSPQSPWNERLYTGAVVPFCLGGYGYVLSQKACRALATAHPPDLDQEIYEDLMVGKLLRRQHIYPKSMVWERQPCLVSPEHRLRSPINYHILKLKMKLKRILGGLKIIL